MKFRASNDACFEWPSERIHRTLPRDVRIKTLIFDMTYQKVDRIQIELTSNEGEIYSEEIGGVGIRGSLVPMHVPIGTDIRSVGYSGSSTRVLRFHDKKGSLVLDTNPDYEGEFITYEVPPGQKLIGFNGSLKN